MQRISFGSAFCPAADAAKALEPLVSGFPNAGQLAKALFATLSEGGSVNMPFGPTFWAKGFGGCGDKFGTPWMVNCQ